MREALPGTQGPLPICRALMSPPCPVPALKVPGEEEEGASCQLCLHRGLE